jgi:hypothetical protein
MENGWNGEDPWNVLYDFKYLIIFFVKLTRLE